MNILTRFIKWRDIVEYRISINYEAKYSLFDQLDAINSAILEMEAYTK